MNKPLAIGCIAVSAILAIMAALAVLLGPKLVKVAVGSFKTAFAEAQRISDLETNWKPPSDLLDASWFPKSVGSWERQGEPAAVTTAPELDDKGVEATYASSGETVKVQVRRANPLEKEALFAREKTDREHQNGTRTSSQTGNRLSSTVNGTERKVIWWIKGWYLVFQTHGTTELAPFAETYLGAAGAEPEAAPEPEKAAPKPATE